MLIDVLKEDNLIITDDKKSIITEINSCDRLIQYKVMTSKEFLDNYFFSYDKKTLKYLVENYDLSVEVALEYLNLLVYIEDKDYKNVKLNYLVEIKNKLRDNNLLYTNSLFKDYLSNTNIVVYDLVLDPFVLDILKSYNYTIINSDVNKKILDVYEFSNIEDEIGFVCFDIKKRLDKGTDINSIKVVSSSEYENVLDRIFKWSNIPLDYPKRVALYNLPVGKRILSLLDKDKSIDEIILELGDIDEDILSKIISILNDYVEIGINIDMIIYDLKNTIITNKHVTNAVKVININDVSTNDICYVVGFNKENYPKVYKDEDIISDDIKKKLGILTATDKNSIESLNLLNKLYKFNFIITYKLRDSFDKFNKPLIFKEEDINLVKSPSIEYNFSNMYNKEKLSSLYDDFYKYGVVSEELVLLKENYDDIEYNTYDNSFTGIDNQAYLSRLNKLSVSYSSIDNYFRCGFRYYLNSVLKIDDFDSDDFYLNIGSIFHYVLSKYKEKDFDFDKYWNEEASKYTFTLDKLIFLENLKKELKYDLDVIRKQENLSSMNNYLFEKRLTLTINNKYNKDVVFTGVVDKIIYTKKDNKTLVSIIDYKTGTLHTDISNMIYGIGMQLPIYLYLVKKSELFPNSIIVGFYLQKIINKDVKEMVNKTVDKQKEDALRLVGYSNYDHDIISTFDSSFKDSSLIQGLRCKNDGDFYSYSKVLDNNQIDKIEEIVDGRINEGINNILDAKFDINPKRIDNNNVGCEFCSYHDICFRRESNITDLVKQDIHDYLGGDTNGSMD